MAAICIQNSRSLSSGRVQGRRAGDTSAYSGLEIAAYAGFYGVRAPVCLEARQIEAKSLHALPEVRVVDPAAIRVKRVDHLEKPALAAGGLGRRVQERRAGVFAADRKVTEDDPGRPFADLDPGGCAVGAAEVGIDDEQLAIAARVVVAARWRDGGAGQLAAQASTDASASKIRLAPGISNGVDDSCAHSTVPSSSISTSERLAWPVASM